MLMQLGTNPSGLVGDGGVSGLAGALSGSAMGGTAALTPLLMGFVYPQLKPMLEASIRKVTVKVEWREGLRGRDIEVVQYVTNPMKVAPAAGLGSAMPGMLGPPGLTGTVGGAVPSLVGTPRVTQ